MNKRRVVMWAAVLLAVPAIILACGADRPDSAAPGGTGLLTGRCWTPPTLLGEALYARDNKEIVALSFKR